MKKRFLSVSILLSVISITLTLLINLKIAKEYQHVHGKNRALFGITEIFRFDYQFYVLLIGLIALSFSILAKSNKFINKYLAIILSTIAITIVFLRIWRLFV